MGWIEIEADDVADLGDELGVVGKLEGVDAVGLQTKGIPDLADRGVTEAAGAGHAPSAPVGGVPRHGFQGLGQHGLDLFVTDLSRGSRPRLVEEAGKSALDETLAPLEDGVVVDSKLARHLGAAQPVGAAKNNARALGQTVARLDSLGPSDQLRTIRIGNPERNVVGTAAWHGVNLNERPAGGSLIMSRISVPGH